MNCDCTEKISLLIDGELSPAEARELERHLVTCVECQEARADFLSLRSQINEFPVAFKPVAQRDALERILGKEKAAGRGRNWRWLLNPALAAFASLLILGAVIGLLIYPRLKPVHTPADFVASDSGKKPGAMPQPSRSPEQSSKGAGQSGAPQKGSQPPAGTNRTKVPNKKPAPVVIEPPQDNIARNQEPAGPVRSADAETMTAIHFQKSELLLRSFRNVRLNKTGSSPELGYEKKLAQQLVYQNMVLRREADAAGDAQVSSLLDSLEPILLDIANLPEKARQGDVRAIKDRVERKNIVALLQVNSLALARALD